MSEQEHGRSGSDEPSGLRPFGAEPASQSQAKPLVPNAVGYQLWPLERQLLAHAGDGSLPRSAQQKAMMQAAIAIRGMTEALSFAEQALSVAANSMAPPVEHSLYNRALRMVRRLLRNAQGIVAATAGETEGLDERSEQSPVAEGDAPK